MPYCNHRRDSNSLPRFQVLLQVLTCTLHMAHLFQMHLHELGYVQLFQICLHSPLLVPPMWDHIIYVQPLQAREVPALLLVGTHNLVITDSRTGSVPFPKPRALVLPLVHFGQSKPEGHTGLDTADSDLMHHQFRLSLLQWNPCPARKNPTNIVSAACGKFHAVILQEASDHVPHISDQFMAFTGNTDLAILLNKDTFEPDPIVNSFKADSTSKGTWGMILLIVRGFLRRPSITGSPTVTFCSVHIHNVVAKKRDASTDLLQRLHGYMCEYNVDFIGGDFNMSAFSTVGDVFTDQEFSAPGNSLLWGLGALEEPNRECAGFLIRTAVSRGQRRGFESHARQMEQDDRFVNGVLTAQSSEKLLHDGVEPNASSDIMIVSGVDLPSKPSSKYIVTSHSLQPASSTQP